MQHFDFEKHNRIVIKIGSALIAPDGKSCSVDYCLPLANFIRRCHAQNKEVFLVSSGAVAAGFNQSNAFESPSLVEKQALAAIGQSILIAHWQKFFDRSVAQVLLTKDDVNQSDRAINAKNTLSTLLKINALPVVNENDTVATEELKLSDNDNLAVHVAKLINADLLIICSDVDGLFDKNPKQHQDAKLISYLEEVNEGDFCMLADKANSISRGGMQSKLGSAKQAADLGIETLICNGTNESYMQLLQNTNPGTWIKANSKSTQIIETNSSQTQGIFYHEHR